MKRVVHKYEALSRRILGEYGQFQGFAEDVGISQATLYRKLMGASAIEVEEMFRWCQLLQIQPMEIPVLFDISGTMKRVMSA